jgi:hypothetical protein
MQILSDDKINVIENKIIIACTGSVGLSQRFHDVVTHVFRQNANLLQMPCLAFAAELSRMTLTQFENSKVPQHPQSGLGFGSLLAAPFADAAQLVEFADTDFQPEIKTDRVHFVSMGSGQVLADPFLAFISRVLWGGSPPNVQMGAFGVYWVLSHTIKYAPGGVGHPIKIAVLKKQDGDWFARSVEGNELQEPEQHVAEIERLIGEYPRSIIENAPATSVTDATGRPATIDSVVASAALHALIASSPNRRRQTRAGVEEDAPVGAPTSPSAWTVWDEAADSIVEHVDGFEVAEAADIQQSLAAVYTAEILPRDFRPR